MYGPSRNEKVIVFLGRPAIDEALVIKGFLATLGRANHPPEGRLLSAGYGQQGQEQAYCRSAEVV